MIRVISEITILPCMEHGWMLGISFPIHRELQFFPIAIADTKEELAEIRDLVLDSIDNLLKFEGALPATPVLPQSVERFLQELDLRGE